MRNPWAAPGARLFEIIRSWCFPSTCRLCGLPGTETMELCAPCYSELILNDNFCERCAIPLPYAGQGTVCGRCLKTPPHFDRSISLLRYQPPASYLVQSLKFRQQLGNAELLGNLLADRILQESGPLPECMIPVPLHPARLRERGFNQSVVIARTLQRRLNIGLLTGHCMRTRNTASQSSLSMKDRRHNLRDAFRMRKPLTATHVAIVDDVVTTGNTVNELARVLRCAGAKNIEVWSLARA